MTSSTHPSPTDPLFRLTPPSRLPEATRLGPVHFQVSDIQRSVTFYRDVLGMTPIEVSDTGARMVTPGAAEPLVVLRTAPGTVRRKKGTFGLFHVALRLPDPASLGRFIAHLEAWGVPLGTADHRVSEAVYLSDPDGLGIEVYVDRPRDSWQYLDREVVMTTEPLDIQELIAAADGVPWTGMPSGTIVGHVHLHVGDLDAATTFYGTALGFDLTATNYPGARFFSAGGYHHHLGTNVWAPGPPPDPMQARLLEWTLTVPTVEDAEMVRCRLWRAGVPATAEGTDWIVVDPWETKLRITPATITT